MSFKRQYNDRIIPILQQKEFTDMSTSTYFKKDAPITAYLPETTPVFATTRQLESGLVVEGTLAKLGNSHDVRMTPWGLPAKMRFPSTEKYVMSAPKVFGRVNLYGGKNRHTPGKYGATLASLCFSLGYDVAAKNDREARLVEETKKEIGLRQSDPVLYPALEREDSDSEAEQPVTHMTLPTVPLSTLKQYIYADEPIDRGKQQLELRVNANRAGWQALDPALSRRGLVLALTQQGTGVHLENIIRQQFGLPLVEAADRRTSWQNRSDRKESYLAHIAVTAPQLTELLETNFRIVK